MGRAQSSRIARELAKAANVCTVVHHIVGALSGRPVGKSGHNVLECPVKCHCVIERAVEQAIGHFSVVCAYLVQAHRQSS